MTAAIRDLHMNHSGKFETGVDTTAMQVWQGNPYITKFNHKDIVKLDNDKDDKYRATHDEIKEIWDSGKIPSVKLHYDLIHQSNTCTGHFIDGFCDGIEDLLNVRIKNRKCYGDIYISDVERSWVSQVQEVTESDTHFWIVVNGGKYDFTCKWWDPFRMQKVVNAMRHITFVQVGEKGHNHHPLVGPNVIDFIGKTDIRQLIRLVYHSSGAICPVTFMMHLAAAVPVRPEKTYARKTRPCVVIAGGREPSRWEAYTNHAYLHKCGTLACCDNGGCWKSRVVPLGDEDEKDKDLCLDPVTTENGIIVPKCMKMITVSDVIEAIESYLP